MNTPVHVNRELGLCREEKKDSGNRRQGGGGWGTPLKKRSAARIESLLKELLQLCKNLGQSAIRTFPHFSTGLYLIASLSCSTPRLQFAPTDDILLPGFGVEFRDPSKI